ncbi:MAG: tetratricopeptide repeat protein [Hyphomicrobiales bacterium]|nr:tetratricopeptide repeat protein [Hyphomicrobiales bacterium]
MRATFLVAVSMIALAGVARATAADDISAAKAAVEANRYDEAIRLYTQALSDSALGADQRVQALRGRGGGYLSRSMIADAFGRKDEAARFGEDAVRDFSEALKAQGDDAELYAARGQAEYSLGRYAEAIADYSEAIKRKSSVETLLQRAAAERASADVDRAVADYGAALDAQDNSPGSEKADILDDRAFTYFLAGKFDLAAADFAKALSLGMGERANDVLWLPYQTVWLHLARLRAGTDDSQELKDNASRVNLGEWPGSAVNYFLGQTTLEQLSTVSPHGGARNRECNVSFFVGEQALAKGEKAPAAEQFRKTTQACGPRHVFSIIARQELARIER